MTNLAGHPKTIDETANFTRSLAVVIGIDIYSNGIRPLTTAVNDATRLADLLRTTHGYETILLTEPAIGQPVTQTYLHKFLTEDLTTRLGDDDRLLVYFAGHGVALDGEDGPRGYLATQDANPQNSDSFLAMTDLHAWLTDLPCRHMLAILDCCFAGAFRWSATRQLRVLPDVIYKERYDRYLRSPAWQVLTSAAYDQEALDILAGNALGRRESDHNLHSPFALALFDALEKGDADLIPKGQGDGVITATELYLYLREQVEVQAENLVNHEQTPGLWPLNKHRKGEFIFLAPGHPLNLPPAPTLTEEANPYRGLKSYEQKDSPIFFGRDQEIEELAAQVDGQPFLAVVGASGTGKSSLVKAGLLPHLEEEELPLQLPAVEGQPAERKYQVLKPLRPTDQPVQALAATLREALDGDPIRLTDDNGLSVLIEHWAAAHPRQRLVLIIDQFEELVTLCRDEVREHFLRLLATAIQQQPDTLRLIITLRTDFEPQFTQEKSPLAELWKVEKNRFVVPPMDIEDLRQVIEGPASVRVLYFDPSELVDDLIEEVIQTPGALPLLSFTLSELYIKYVQSGREDRALSGVDYKALGGVVGSLRNRATEEYTNLPDDAHRRTMQKVMLRMVSVEGSELARRRVALSELVYPTEEENVRVQAVLDRLVDARLLVSGTVDNPDGTKGEAYIEPAHDALVLAWDKLLRWKKEAEEYLPLQRRLALATTEWVKADTEAKSGYLWDSDPRLPQLEETLWPTADGHKRVRGRIRWAQQVLMPRTDRPEDTRWLNGAEVSFVQDSVKTRARFWVRTVLSVAAFILVLISATGVSLVFQNQAVTEAERADIEAENARNAQGTAVAEATRALNAEGTAVAEAGRAERSAQAEATAAANARLKQTEAEREAAIANARLLANQSQAASVREPTQSLLLAVEAISVTTAITTGYSFFRVAEADQALIDALQKPLGVPLYSKEGRPNDVAFSPSAHWVAVGTDEGRVLLWDLNQASNSPVIFCCHSESVGYIEFDPTERWVIAADGDGNVILWEIADPGGLPLTLSEHKGWVESFSVSSNGEWLASSGIDGSVWLWNLKELDAEPIVRDFTDAKPATDIPDWKVKAQVQFLPNKQQLVVYVNTDDTVFFWNLVRIEDEPSTLSAGIPIGAAYLSPNGKWLVISNNDAPEIRIWEIEHLDVPPRVFRDLGQWNIRNISFSPDSSEMVTYSYGDVAQRWDMQNLDKDPIQIWTSNLEVINFVAYSPNGRWVAYGMDDYTKDYGIELYARDETNTVPIILHSKGGGLKKIAFSNDGRWLAALDASTTIRLWDTNRINTQPYALQGHEGKIWSMDFSSDGHWLASGSGDVTARLWDFHDPQRRHLVLHGHQDRVSAVIFHPDGERLITGSGDGTIRFYDLSNFDTPPTILSHTTYEVDTMAISNDGRWLASAKNNDARVWDLQDQEKPPRQLPTDQDQIPAVAFSRDNQWLAVPNNGVLDLWNMDSPSLHSVTISTTLIDSGPSFSSDGRWLAIGSERIVQLWSLGDLTSDPVLLHPPIAAASGEILAIAFSPDARWLAALSKVPSEAGALDGIILIWDLLNLDSDARQLRHLGINLDVLTFSSDGRYIIAADEDGVIWVWDWHLPTLQNMACYVAGRNFTWDEWSQINLQNEPYRPTCPQWPAHASVIQSYTQFGENLARQGHVLEATSEFETILALDPDWKLDQRNFEWLSASTYANRLFGGELEMRAKSFAFQGEISQAVDLFWQAKEYDPRLGFDPETIAGQLYAPKLVQEAESLAIQGEVEEAIARFTQANEYDPSLEIDAEARAGQLYASVLEEEAGSLAIQGEVEEAIARFTQANEYDPSLGIDAEARATELVPAPITYGEEVTGTVTAGSGQSWVFEGRTGERITIIQTDLGESGLDTYLTLYGPDGESLAENDDFYGLNSQIDLIALPEDGNYIILAGGLRSSSGQYRLELSLEEGTP
jgi:WD40 repeat protein/tetratricopeptide (TPR) repeat protein/energy-coupling factor transporter ATP-binding protein EcfA2